MDPKRIWNIFRFALTFLAMFTVWLVFIAHPEPLMLAAGGAGSIIIAALTYDVFIPKNQAHLRFLLPNPFYLIIYLARMVFHLYQASIRMLGAVITGRAHPRIVHFRTPLRSDLARMALANSITITPGTLTLDLNDDHLTVHWFFATTSHSKRAGELIKGRMERDLGKVWI